MRRLCLAALVALLAAPATADIAADTAAGPAALPAPDSPPLPAAYQIADPAFDAAVLAHLNRARTQPQAFIEDLKAFRQTFNAQGHYRNLSDGTVWASREGAAAVDEAIAYLARMSPRPRLEASPLLAAAAFDHSVDQGPRGGVGHISSNGRRPADRLRSRGGGGYVAEAISYGQGSPLDVVIQLIVDDGVEGRGHRQILLNPEYGHAGAGCGAHKDYRLMCTIALSTSTNGK